MGLMYQIALIISTISLLYTLINIIFIMKLMNLLSKNFRQRYNGIIYLSVISFFISLVLIIGQLKISVYIFKFLMLVVSLFVNTYVLSETASLREYI